MSPARRDVLAGRRSSRRHWPVRRRGQRGPRCLPGHGGPCVGRGPRSQWVDSLDAAQQARGKRPFADATRTDWHFVPKPARKGVQLRDMTPAQEAGRALAPADALSEAGYEKSLEIMSLERDPAAARGEKAKNIRDPKRYFFTVFGTPAETGTWSVSIEGHHLSFNFLIRDGAVVDSTPQFMGANPAEVKTTFAGLPDRGHRVLHDEEAIAFDLVQSLDAGPASRPSSRPRPRGRFGGG